MERVIWMNLKKKKKPKTPPNMGEAIRSNNYVQSQGGGRVWTNNHKQHCSWNLIKLLMTCHSRALQMFIDAHYQPHSSSVRVAALAAMSPTTPTHLVLPPHTSRGGGGGWGGWGGTETQHFLSGCWWRVLSGYPVLFAQSTERAAVWLFIY